MGKSCRLILIQKIKEGGDKMGVLPVLKADIAKPRGYKYLLSKQYDNMSRTYKLLITNDGALWDGMTDNMQVRIRMWAEGETEPYVDKWLDETWVEGCPVITFTSNMLSKIGNVTYEFVLQEPGSMEVVSTMPQNLDIKKSLTNYLGLIESNDFDVLSHLIAEAETIPEFLADIATTKEEVESLIASVNTQMSIYQTEFNQMSADLQVLMTSVQTYMSDIENAAAASAKRSESWAIGGTGTRDGEDTNCSEYHSNQSKLEADRAKTEADRAEQYAGNVDPKTLSQVNAVDVNGLIGTVGSTVVSQNLINKISDDVVQNADDIINIQSDLTQKIDTATFNASISTLSTDIYNINNSLSQKVDNTDLNNEVSTRQSAVTNLQNQISAIITQSDNYYVQCLSTDSGALLIVASGATSGQINISDVSPHMSDYTPAVGQYTRKLNNGLTAELFNARIGADGVTYGSTGDAIRGQCGKNSSNLFIINPDLNESLKYSYDVTQAKNSLSGKIIFLLPYKIDPFYSAFMEVYADRDAIAYIYLFNESRTKITAKKGIVLNKGINRIDISDIKNKNISEYIGIASPDGGFTYNSDGTTVTEYDFNFYVTYDTLPNLGDLVSSSSTSRSRLCCDFYMLEPSKAAKYDDVNAIKSDLGYDTQILKCLISDYNPDIPMNQCADDWIYVLGDNSIIPKVSTKINLDIYSNGGTGTIYLITKKEYLIKYKYTTSLSLGINSYEIDVSNFNDELLVAFYANTVGAFCYQRGDLYEFSNADPMGYYGAWNASYAVGSNVELTRWIGNINTNKSYAAIDLYISLPIEKKKTNVIRVSKNGNGDYTTINDAIRNAGDIDNPTTIFLYPGVYNEVVYLRGKHNISIVGTDRDRCIILNDTGKYCNSPLVIGGEFELRNLTIKMTLDSVGSYVPTYDSNNVFTTYPGYALHIDCESKDRTKPATGRISNCTCYSEAFPAVGMGVNQNQTIIFENCEFIRKCTTEIYKQDNWKGAFIGHSSNVNGAINQNLVIRNCVFESNYGYSGNLKADLGDSNNFTLTAINNTFYSETNGVDSFEYEKGFSVLHPMSHGNTAQNLNI